MDRTLHITSGDCAGAILARSGVPGEVFVWHDILYDGPRKPGWPGNAVLSARAQFIEEATGGGLDRGRVLDTLRRQYEVLAAAAGRDRLVLWFDACLFDQAMLVHILACLDLRHVPGVELLCVDAFPGIEPFDGLGQLTPAQMASLYGCRRPVTDAQYRFAAAADRAFAAGDAALLGELACAAGAPLPWLPPAAARWLRERPDPETGLGRLESLALAAVRGGADSPARILRVVAAADGHPRYWGDFALWAKINALAGRTPPLVKIAGPASRLPQWEGGADLERFRITASPGEAEAGAAGGKRRALHDRRRGR